MFRTQSIGMVNWALLAVMALSWSGPAARAAETAPDLARQEERQKRIKAETDRLVRRVETMIRLLEYNRLDKTAEKQLLDQVAGTLSGLSRQQMMHLIDALEKAGKVDGEARGKELQQAQQRHEQIVLGLKGLLARFDAVKSLDQAVDRLDKLARDELDHYLQTVQLAWEDENASSLPRNEAVRVRAGKLVSEQLFLHRDLSNLVGQLNTLKKLLPTEHQERYRKMTAALRASNLLDNLMTAGRQLGSVGRRWIVNGHGARPRIRNGKRPATFASWRACCVVHRTGWLRCARHDSWSNATLRIRKACGKGRKHLPKRRSRTRAGTSCAICICCGARPEQPAGYSGV